MPEPLLTDRQRSDLLDFITEVDRSIGDATFDPEDDFSDHEILVLALMGAQLLGVSDDQMGAFFQEEFGLDDIDENALGELFVIIMMTDVENRIRAAAGGRN